MAKDPVCGMDVDPATAQHTSEHQGQTYYFCAPGCRSDQTRQAPLRGRSVFRSSRNEQGVEVSLPEAPLATTGQFVAGEMAPAQKR